MKIPDAIEPAVGFRVWEVDKNTYRLHSMNHGTIWEPGREVEAYCTREHEPPGQACSCGIYAARTFNHLFEMGYTGKDGLFGAEPGTITIAGEVYLWGGMVPGTQGWRAQFAYPKRFLIAHTLWKWATPVSLLYSVPYKLHNTRRKH
jgi:hypothetical protein